MKQNINVIPFRVSLVHATTAISPLVIDLPSMQGRLMQINMWTAAAPDMTKTGWRLLNKGQIIIPSSVFGEGGITFAVGETGWCPFPSSHVDLDLYDFAVSEIDKLQFQFYNSTVGTDYVIGGFIQSRDPVHGVDDLVRELAFMRQRYEAGLSEGHSKQHETANYSTPEHARRQAS